MNVWTRVVLGLYSAHIDYMLYTVREEGFFILASRNNRLYLDAACHHEHTLPRVSFGLLLAPLMLGVKPKVLKKEQKSSTYRKTAEQSERI